jgi:hypothetical protein
MLMLHISLLVVSARHRNEFGCNLGLRRTEVMIGAALKNSSKAEVAIAMRLSIKDQNTT